MTDAARSSQPLWLSIAETLRGAIAEGQYQEGSRLPTEAELAKRFGVNRHTVRHALSKLIDDGLVHSRRGAGTFILAKPIDYPLSDRVRFHRNLQDAGRLPAREILGVEVRQASEAEARRLQMRTGAALCITHSLAFADGTPLVLSESLYPEARHPGLSDALRRLKGVTRALASVGITDYRRQETRLSATAANATQAAHLRLRQGAPLLFAEAVNVWQGLPVEVGRSWFASERITLTLDHGRD